VTLHLVRLPVNARALAAFAVGNGVSDDDGGYALHLALRRRFGAAGPQPFRFIADDAVAPYLLGYVADADALADAAALPAADPLLDGVFSAAPALRAMPEAWRMGARYGFEVRLRPVVRFSKRLQEVRAALPAAQAKDGWWARAGEVDVWVASRTRGGDGERWAANARDGDAVRAAIAASPTREEAYLDWLATRLANAAMLEEGSLRQFRRTRTRRSSHGQTGRGRIEGPDALMAGTLIVGDPAAFAHLLARGVGRHAAFGFGMLLLSPPRRIG
jgi:CRISPR system Cascade subunit CasE